MAGLVSGTLAKGFMMKKLLLAGVLAVACSAGSAQAATTINFVAGGSTLPADTKVVQNFDSFAAGTSIGTNAAVYNTNTPNAVRPTSGSTGNYAAVTSGGSYTFNFAPTNIFSFVLGSLDSYNSLTLNYADGTSSLLSGGAIINAATIDPNNRNGVVTYRVTSGSLLSSATFSSQYDAFEFDNLAVAVPEPAAWAMMIVGFALVGGALRRRSRTSTQVTFA